MTLAGLAIFGGLSIGGMAWVYLTTIFGWTDRPEDV